MEHWDGGDLYEAYMGRWSRQVAREFVSQAFFQSQNGRWLDLGCGTGALTQAVVDVRQPESVVGVDASPGFVRYTRQRVQDSRTQFAVANA
ncbi:MAG: class I SAM-dependent methyltransferase, partial [Anaerolineae bacterium]|nr:class I SAM-dependent methyltransferase [Anaerolineae bacterium]